MSNKTKRDSPLVTAVLALQNHLTELERVGAKINSADLTAEIDVEYIQKLMARFAECGQGISEEVNNLSMHLREATTRAEGVAQGVSRQAEAFAARRKEQDEKLEQFRLLGERVGAINAAISVFRRAPGQALTDEDRTALAANVPELEGQLATLITELQDLRNSARSSKMRGLEKNAESLAQSLQAAQLKLRDLIR
jgi:chromosome segregation ATPase